MNKPRCFDVRICISLPEEHVEFLKGMVERGEADSISQAVRKCISLAAERVGKGGGA